MEPLNNAFSIVMLQLELIRPSLLTIWKLVRLYSIWEVFTFSGFISKFCTVALVVDLKEKLFFVQFTAVRFLMVNDLDVRAENTSSVQTEA